MESFNVKIKKATASQNQEIKNALNLNQTKLDAARPKIKKRRLWLMWLSLAGATVGGLILGWLFFVQKPASLYAKLIPPDAALTLYLNQSSFPEIIKALSTNQPNWPPLTWTKEELQQLEAKINLKLAGEILPLFNDRLVLVILPDSEPPLKWLILATQKATGDNFASVLAEAEKNLKQSLHLVTEPYRQTKIIQVKPLNQNFPSLFYAQAKNYFFLTNSGEVLKETINKAID